MRMLKENEIGVLTVAPEKNRAVRVLHRSFQFSRWPDVPISEFPVYTVTAANNKPLKTTGGNTANFIHVSQSGIVPVGAFDLESPAGTVISWAECMWNPDEMKYGEDV